MRKLFPLIIGLCVIAGAFVWVITRDTAVTTLVEQSHRDEIDTEREFQNIQITATSSNAIRIPILIYHSVIPDHKAESREQKAYSVTPEMLDAQLTFLEKHGYSVVSLASATQMIEYASTTGKKPVVITFDDGWKNQIEYALPILKKHHMTATFYIYTNPIGNSPKFMTWDDVHALIAAGMSIGSHTLTHPYMSKLTDTALKKQIFDSKKILESKIHLPIVDFASPFGYTSPELMKLLKKAGYTTGRTTYKGSYHSKEQLLHLTGYLVNRNMLDFEWMIQYAP